MSNDRQDDLSSRKEALICLLSGSVAEGPEQIREDEKYLSRNSCSSAVGSLFVTNNSNSRISSGLGLASIYSGDIPKVNAPGPFRKDAPDYSCSNHGREIILNLIREVTK